MYSLYTSQGPADHREMTFCPPLSHCKSSVRSTVLSGIQNVVLSVVDEEKLMHLSGVFRSPVDSTLLIRYYFLTFLVLMHYVMLSWDLH